MIFVGSQVKVCVATAFVGIAVAQGVSAAVLFVDAVQRYTGATAPTVNLSTTGTTDWAYWQQEGASYASPLAPTNEKSGGTAIGGVSAVGGLAGSVLRGTANTTTVGKYSWSGGTTSGSGSGSLDSGFVFNSSTANNTAGFSLQIAGTPGVLQYVVLYLGGFSATGNLSMTLAGITGPVTDNSAVYSGISPKEITAYQIAFTPDSASDLLTINYTSTGTGANGHVGIEAVTVGLNRVIPEPSTALLGGLGVLFLIRRRRA